jgi:hypothetical protein
MPRGIGSWRRHGNNGRSVGSGPYYRQNPQKSTFPLPTAKSLRRNLNFGGHRESRMGVGRQRKEKPAAEAGRARKEGRLRATN